MVDARIVLADRLRRTVLKGQAMNLEEEIAQVLHSVCGCGDGPSEDTYYEAGLLVPLVKRAQAEALRDAARDARQFLSTYEAAAWLDNRAARIENEGAGAHD